MKKTRRLIAVGAVVALSLSALAGCSKDNNNTTTTAEGQGAMSDYTVGSTFKATEPLTISLLYRDHSNYPFKADWLAVSQFTSQNNITFDYTSVPISDWGTQKPIIIASGQAPDLIPVTYTSEQSTYATGGAILPISDYIDQMPNFQDKIQKWGLQSELDTLKQADGKFYVLPGIHEKIRTQYTIAINETKWKAAGITSDPTTWDEFATDLQKIKDANLPGVTFPMSDRWKMGSILNQAGPGFNTISGTTDVSNTWGYGSGIYYNGKNFEYAGANDGQKQMLTYFADLVKKGLLDPDSLAQDDAPAIAKFTNGQTVAISTNDQTIVTDLRNTMMGAGNTDEVKMLRVPAGPYGDYMIGNHMESGLMLASTAKDEPYFQALLQFVDWLYYSDSGLQFGKWGVECPSGVTDSTQCTYTEPSEGVFQLLPDIRYNGINQQGDGTSQKQLNVDYGFSNGEWMLANGSTWELESSMFSDDAKNFTNDMSSKKLLPQSLPPAAPLDEDTSSNAALIQTNLTTIMVQDVVAYISGTTDIATDWDNHVQRLKDAGMDDFVGYYNTAAGLS